MFNSINQKYIHTINEIQSGLFKMTKGINWLEK